MHASQARARQSCASGSKYSDCLFIWLLILTPISRSPLNKVSVPGFSIRFHWIRVNKRPKRIEMYPGFCEYGAV